MRQHCLERHEKKFSALYLAAECNLLRVQGVSAFTKSASIADTASLRVNRSSCVAPQTKSSCVSWYR